MYRLGPFSPAWGFLLLFSLSVAAQEALRSAVVGDRAYEQRQLAVATDTVRTPAPDQIHWGPVLFNVGVSLAAEWNDNIRLSQSDPRKDFILRPQADLDLLWPITPKATLQAGVGFGYEKYIKFTEYDRFNIIPDSEIAVDMLLGDVVLTLFERISYSQDVISQPELSGEAAYPRLENTVGFRASRVIQDWLVQGGYSHFNFIAFDDFYEYLDRSSELFFLRGGYMVAPRTTVGLESSFSLSDYELDVRNDFISFSAGPYLDWTIADPLRLTLRGGYVIYLYDDTATLPAPENVDSYYAGITLNHRLTEFISHSLDVVHGIDVGIEADAVERTRAGYGISWQFIDPASVSLGVFFQRGQEFDTPVQVGEDYIQIGGNIGLAYRLTDRLGSSLGYTFTRRASDQPGGDYDRNSVVLTVSYRF